MVRLSRISIPDAYIIDDENDKKRHKNDCHTIEVPMIPALDVYPWPNPDEMPDEIEQCQSTVIIIEL
jgi:hypothetical protein